MKAFFAGEFNCLVATCIAEEGLDIGEVDLAGYARSLGASGYTVREPDEMVPALEAALASGQTALVDVVVDPDLISPSAQLSDLTARSSQEDL